MDWDLVRGGLRAAPGFARLAPFSRISPALLVRERARRDGDALALAYLDDRYTWREMYAHACQYANWFSAEGIGRGDRVAIVMDNRPDFLFALAGLSSVGAVGALVNTNLSGGALAHALRVAEPRAVLAGGEHLDRVREVAGSVEGLASDALFAHFEAGGGDSGGARAINAEVDAASTSEPSPLVRPTPRETFCYIYTSGTTGLPKAAIISNLRMLGGGLAFGHVVLSLSAGETLYVALPLYHSSAMFLGWSSALWTGAAIAIRRKFSASNFFPDIRRFDATAFIYIGELCRYLLATPEQPSDRDHRIRVASGNGLRPDIWEAFQERFGIPKIREFYGATEGNAATVNFEGRPGMIGKLVPGQAVVRCDPETGEAVRDASGRCTEVDVGDVGLFVARISTVASFDGYVDRSASDKKVLRDVFKRGDRYFDTGDLVQLHEGRWLSFADRVGDTFRWKGENVSTNEVAETLNHAPGVRESNVYGVQIPGTEGRAGMAALRVDAEFDIDSLAKFVHAQMPRYQRPLFVRILGEMQITGTFKHRKVDYRKEGFDPGKVADPLFFLDGEKYAPLDAATFARIESGELRLG